MTMIQRTPFLVLLTAILIIIGVPQHSAVSAQKKCWNLMSVKAEWQKLNADGHFVEASPEGIRYHLSTDGSWQWIEYHDPRNLRYPIFARAGWSPPKAVLLSQRNENFVEA